VASKEICCLRGFVTGITSTADYGVDSDSDVFITTGSVSRFFLWEYLSWFLSCRPGLMTGIDGHTRGGSASSHSVFLHFNSNESYYPNIRYSYLATGRDYISRVGLFRFQK